MKQYKGTILGFSYEVELDNDIDFENYLEAKLLRYQFKKSELKILRKILGIKSLDERVKALEELASK